MRLLEIAFLILTFALLIWSLRRNSAKSLAFSIIAGCTFLVLILHLIIEGWRGQMLPAYVVGAIILAIAVKRKLSNRDLDTQPKSKFRFMLKILLSSYQKLPKVFLKSVVWLADFYSLYFCFGEWLNGVEKQPMKHSSKFAGTIITLKPSPTW